MKRFVYIFLLLALLSCDKEKSAVREGDVMQFAVLAPDIVSTRAEVTDAGLRGDDPVYVYGMSSDGSVSSPVFASPGTAQLQYNSNTGIWKPIQKKINADPDVSDEYEDVEWDRYGRLYYQFYGYAFSSNATLGTDLKIGNEASGRQFTIKQPENKAWLAPGNLGGVVDGSGTVDYLLSYLVNVPPSQSGNYPLVKLQLEHAMAKVEVDVQIANAMLVKDNQGVVTGSMIKDLSVEIKGVKRGATMLCLQPKLDTESGSNTWIVTLDEALSRASYKVQNIMCSEANLAEGQNLISTDMSFIAVPVTKAEMSEYKLILQYYNSSDDTTQDPTYRYEFALKDFTPNGWVSGHRVRYVLTVDNSIHLSGSVVDYQDVDYLEGVLLPDIPGTI